MFRVESKGHSDLVTTFASLKRVVTQPEIKCTRRIHPEIRFNLRSSIFYRKPLFEQTLTHPMALFLSYLVKNGIQRNKRRRGEKRVGAEWEKSPSFAKITKEMNQ